MRKVGMRIVAIAAMGLAAGCGCCSGNVDGKAGDVATEVKADTVGKSDAPRTVDAKSDSASDARSDTAADAKLDAGPDSVGDSVGDTRGVDAQPSDSGPDVPGTPLPVSFSTFNTGLAVNFVPFAQERLAAVVDAVGKLDVEVVCLQEVWEPQHVTALTDGVKATFPYFLYADTSEEGGGGAPACAADELKPLQDCVVKNCAQAEDLTGCVMQNCLTEFSLLKPGCTQCLAANLSKPLEEIFAACTTGSASMSYEGRNGLLLLARRELDVSEHLVLESFLLRRVVLHATFKNDPSKTHVFCTHLSAALSEMEYSGKYASWEAEQAAQIDQMAKWIKDKASGAPAVLMGDMNCGPAIPPGIPGEFPANFAKFEAAGLASPYVTKPDPECTWCAANTLIEDDDADQIIDHVLYSGFPPQPPLPSAVRILDEPVEVTVGEAVQETNLSDHFGVQWK